MMRRTATMLAATGVFVTLLTGTAAAAGDDEVHTTEGGGRAEWIENGDTLRVCDLRADGYGVRGYIYRRYPDDWANGTVLIKASDPKSDGNCVAVSEDISETITISMKVCRYKGAWVGNCDWVGI